MKMTDIPAAEITIDPRSEAFVERFGGFLVERGILGELTVKRAVRAQQQSGERFDLVLTRLGLIPEADLARILADYLGLPLAARCRSPGRGAVSERIADRLPRRGQDHPDRG